MKLNKGKKILANKDISKNVQAKMKNDRTNLELMRKSEE
jgi:hypothetical protein